MNKITFVALNRAEGLSKYCTCEVFYTTAKKPVYTGSGSQKANYTKVTNIQDAVLRQMYFWGLSAPQNGGYDKVDFTVNWRGKDNYYSGRFDMKFGGTDEGETFWTSLKHRIEFYALLRRPAWMDDKVWDKFLADGQANAKEALKMLKNCEIPA